jgi:hypothetical protein
VISTDHKAPHYVVFSTPLVLSMKCYKCYDKVEIASLQHMQPYMLCLDCLTNQLTNYLHRAESSLEANRQGFHLPGMTDTWSQKQYVPSKQWYKITFQCNGISQRNVVLCNTTVKPPKLKREREYLLGYWRNSPHFMETWRLIIMFVTPHNPPLSRTIHIPSMPSHPVFLQFILISPS